MEKHGFLVLGMFMILLVLSFAIVSASVSTSTLVAGEIYNNNFDNPIEGANVTVQCGTSILSTVSLEDGTYAVTFNTPSCSLSTGVEVTAFKGKLEGSDTSTINNSTDDKSKYIAVSNVNIRAPVTVTVRRNNHGGFFLCGNTVCDSGETYVTCPTDCPEVAPENPNALLDLSFNDGSGNGNPQDRLPSETQTIQNTSNIPGITGAVTGTGNGDGDNDNFWLYLLGLVILLVIAIAVISLVRGNVKRKKMGYN